MKYLKIGLAENAEINKNGDSKTINITKDENSLKLELNEKENKVILKTRGRKTHEYISKK